jgi:hypothetical protein
LGFLPVSFRRPTIVQIEVPGRTDESSTRSEVVPLESIPIFEPDPLNLEPVGIVIHESQLATGPIGVGREYFGLHRAQFESPLPRWWVLKGPFECEPRQNRTGEKGALVPPGKRKDLEPREDRFQSTQRRSFAPKSLGIRFWRRAELSSQAVEV